jgi:hypothetical protein
MTAIKYSVDVLIAGGPRLTYNDTIEVDAYDRLDVVIPIGDVETIVDVRPGGADTIQFLAIRSSVADDQVRFENGAALVGLKNPVLLTGGAVGLLAAVPETLKFKNSLASPVTVTILVGRNAVQQP